METAPLTPERWPQLERLFREGGDPRWCWCMYWRLRAKDFSSRRVPELRDGLRALADGPTPPGIIALEDDRAVGWVSLGPRDSFDRVANSRTIPRLDDEPVWSIVCFVVSRSARGRGVARALLDAAVSFAFERGAPAVEAYPADPAGGPVSPAAAYTGLLPMFLDAGFSVAEAVVSPTSSVRRVVVRRLPA